MINFDNSLFANTRGRTLVCAHRGFCSGNIPCNTIPAFSAALLHGADMIELDVVKSRNGELFVFHPGKEHAHLKKHIPLSLRSSEAIKKMRYVNYDNIKTHYHVERLEDVLMFLKDKCYINIDKFRTAIPEISATVRKCGVEKQVIIKSHVKEKYLKLIEEYAPDLMYIPIVRRIDRVTPQLLSRKLNFVGVETLFELDTDPVSSKAYADSMHEKGLVIFRNSIIYDERIVISAGLSDDNALIGYKDESWGALIDGGADIIQTDFCPQLREYIDTREK